MSAPPAQSLSLAVTDSIRVSALLLRPPTSKFALVLAHGAGAGMEHASMAATAQGLYQRNVATLRFQFPYMEQGSRRPDRPALCHATVRAAVKDAHMRMPDATLWAGGRSFGGRMTSQAQAAAPLDGVRGLVFFGFPLHLAKKPSVDRAQHLEHIKIPMLFLQGTRDELADISLLQSVVDRVGSSATLEVLEHADHSFHVLVRSGRTDAEVRDQMLDAFVAWSSALAG
jgi:uncharacterized protein